jgi:glutamate racemase
VEAAADAAAKATKNGVVGIIGTEATISSGRYSSALRERSPAIHSVARACPLFVPLVENGHFGEDDPLAALAAEEYLEAIEKTGADTLIMGCTHYPLLQGVLRKQLGPKVKLVDPGRETADRLKEKLTAEGMLNGRNHSGTVRYCVTDDPSRFDYFAHIFMGHYAGGSVEQVNIEDFELKI